MPNREGRTRGPMRSRSVPGAGTWWPACRLCGAPPGTIEERHTTKGTLRRHAQDGSKMFTVGRVTADRISPVAALHSTSPMMAAAARPSAGIVPAVEA